MFSKYDISLHLSFCFSKYTPFFGIDGKSVYICTSSPAPQVPKQGGEFVKFTFLRLVAKSAVVFYICRMKLTINNTFDIRRVDGKPITGRLRSTLNYFNMYSILCLARGGDFDFNGFQFHSVFEDQHIRVDVFVEGSPPGKYCELIIEI